MKYSNEWLKVKLEAGEQPDYLFFWGHTPKRKDEVDKSCFSQWFPANFIVNDKTFFTAEHWMMAKKAEMFGDVDALKEILSAEKPAVAKEWGRKVKNFDSEKWNREAFDIVIEGNLHKFSQHEALKEFILKTNDKILVESSPSDAIWGIGLSQNDAEQIDPISWKGTNLLGFALMEVRDILRK